MASREIRKSPNSQSRTGKSGAPMSPSEKTAARKAPLSTVIVKKNEKTGRRVEGLEKPVNGGKPQPKGGAKTPEPLFAPTKSDLGAPERIAKVLSRAGIASRREAERLIELGEVTVNGKVIDSPALNVTPQDRITVSGQPVAAPEPARLWLYHKPLGLVTSTSDEKGRETIFDYLPEDLPRVMTVGRLDLNSEGLLLLTNDGELKRRLELPSTGWLRKYRVRVKGNPLDSELEPLRKGVVSEGEQFAPMQVVLDRIQGANAWLTVGLREGRNREVRRAMAEVGLTVNRLLRISYGPFRLNELQPGEVEEVRPRVLRDQLGLDPQEESVDAPRKGLRVAPRSDRAPRPDRPAPMAPARPARAQRGASNAEGGRKDSADKPSYGRNGSERSKFDAKFDKRRDSTMAESDPSKRAPRGAPAGRDGARDAGPKGFSARPTTPDYKSGRVQEGKGASFKPAGDKATDYKSAGRPAGKFGSKFDGKPDGKAPAKGGAKSGPARFGGRDGAAPERGPKGPRGPRKPF